MRLLGKRWASVALGVLTVGLTGRGGAEQSLVTGTAQRFYAAVRAEDGDEACALLAPSTRSELEQAAGKACPEAILEEAIPPTQGP